MGHARSADTMPVEDYLAKERDSEIKHEYVNGQVVAMTGVSVNHARISGNIYKLLSTSLSQGPCEPFMSDFRVKTANGNYRYPDVLVVCDEQFIEDEHATDSPKVLVEVLSPSTRRVDLKEKLLEYINIPSLEEYVVIEQDCIDVTVYRKSEDWRGTHYFANESFVLKSINVKLAVMDIYVRVNNEDTARYLSEGQ